MRAGSLPLRVVSEPITLESLAERLAALEMARASEPTTFALHLQPRQWQLLRSLVKTGSLKEAAAEFGISESTVKNRLREVYQKLDAHSLVEAYYLLGWLKAPESVA